MDAFRTLEERAFRRKARDFFLRRGDALRSTAPVPSDKIWRELGGAGNAGDAAAPPSGLSLSDRVSIIEEAASRAPALGLDLLAWRASSGPLDPIEERLLRFGQLAGTATHVLEAGAKAAREQGAFASSLMGCREVQEGLAGLVAGTELVRLGICRICRLLDRAERDRAEAESARLQSRALALASDVLSVARTLLGGPWIEANLPADDPPLDNERT